MRTQIDNSVLEVVVNLVCDTLDTFSAYDVTTLVRARLPQHNILHNDVRDIVLNYVIKNNLNVTDNGVYRVFSKKSTAKVGSLPVKITYDDRETEESIANTINKSANKTIQNMKNMINGFGKQKATTFDPNNPVSVSVQVVQKSNKLMERMYNLQSENRLTLPIDVYNKLRSVASRYTINRSSNKIVIVPETNVSYTGSKIRAGQRFRTLFPNNVRIVNVTVYNDRIEITPK